MKCIFHIGPGKTGTSAIQTYLIGSRELLLQAGYLYPETGLWNWRSHNALFLSKEKGRLSPAEVLANAEKLKAEIGIHGPDVLILSAEVVAYSVTDPDLRPWVEALFDALDAEVHVICFARRQDALFDSRFKQFVQGGFAGSPWNFVQRRYRDMFFDKVVERWMEIARVGQVHCIAYDAANPMAGVDDFWRVAGLPVRARGLLAPEVVNPSLDGERLQVKHFFNQFDLDRRTSRKLLRVLARSGVPDRPKITLFNEEAREALLAIFARSNANLEQKFQCLIKAEAANGRKVFEPIAREALKGSVASLSSQDPELMSRVAREALDAAAPDRSDILAERLADRLTGAQEQFRPEQLARKLKELAAAMNFRRSGSDY